MALPPFPNKANNINDKVVIDWFTALVAEVNAGGGGGGGGGAPETATYVTLSSNATLTAERRLTAGTGVAITDAGANSTITVDAQEALQRSWMGL